MVLAQKETHRLMEQNRAPRNKPAHLWSINVHKKEASLYNGEKTVSSMKWYCKNCTATCKRMKVKHYLTPHTEINSKCIIDLNVRPKTIKLLEKKKSRTL